MCFALENPSRDKNIRRPGYVFLSQTWIFTCISFCIENCCHEFHIHPLYHTLCLYTIDSIQGKPSFNSQYINMQILFTVPYIFL